MRRFLVFQLYGPLAAWGGPAVGEVRPTDLKPSRSAILGLLAAALGLRRADDAAHRRLGEELRVGVEVVAAGVPLSDYHTVQSLPRRARQLEAVRADQLRETRDDWETIVSQRDYRCDAVCQVAVWSSGTEGGSTYPLERLAAALEEPHFVLYLGRKACPPALPLSPRLVQASSLHEAFSEAATPFLEGVLPDRMATGTDRLLFWEGEPETGGVTPREVREHRDDPVSRQRWSFRRRREYMGVAPDAQEVP